MDRRQSGARPPAEWIKPHTVLCATDNDCGSERALRWASQFASTVKADLVLVHVEPRLLPTDNEHYSNEYEEQVLAEAGQKMEKLQSAAGMQAEVVIRGGKVPGALSRTVKDLEANLLVIGRKSDASVGLGLNTYGIIRESACPVVSV